MADDNLKDVNEDDDDEILEDKLMTQALPVYELRKDVDLSVPPSTGEDYLSRVKYESSKISKVVVAKVDTKKYEKNRTTQYFQPVCILTKKFCI